MDNLNIPILPIEDQIKNLEEAIAEREQEGPREIKTYQDWISQDVTDHMRKSLERLLERQKRGEK